MTIHISIASLVTAAVQGARVYGRAVGRTQRALLVAAGRLVRAHRALLALLEGGAARAVGGVARNALAAALGREPGPVALAVVVGRNLNDFLFVSIY